MTIAVLSKAGSEMQQHDINCLIANELRYLGHGISIGFATHLNYLCDRPEAASRPTHFSFLSQVEFQGEWHDTRCTTIDCSLVEVTYEIDGSREWIYRGSLRLEPLYKNEQMVNLLELKEFLQTRKADLYQLLHFQKAQLELKLLCVNVKPCLPWNDKIGRPVRFHSHITDKDLAREQLQQPDFTVLVNRMRTPSSD